MSPSEITLSIQGKIFSAQLWGEEGLPVIALHGWLDNSQSFSVLAPELNGIQLLALDMAGHGYSDHRSADASYHIWDDVREVLLLADAMGWQKFSLLGHSRGGVIAAMIAAVAPQRIIGLGLIEGLWPQTIEADAAATQLTKFVDKFMKNAGELSVDEASLFERAYDSLEKMTTLREKGGFGLSAQAAKIIVERNSEVRRGKYFWRTDKRLMMPSPMMLTKEEADSFIQGILCPTTLILADNGIAQVYEKHQQDLMKNLQIDYEVLAGSHHLHMGSQAKLIAEKLNHFFKKIRQTLR